MSGSGWIQDMLSDSDDRLTELSLFSVTPESALHAAVAEIGATPECTPEVLIDEHYPLDAPPPIDARDELPLQAAVAEREAARAETEVLHFFLTNPDITSAWHSNCTTPCASVAGDIIADSSAADNDESDAAVAKRRNRRRAPLSTFQGDREHRSSKWNAEPEVGNFGIFFGNWGTRATLGGVGTQQRRREKQDLQVLKKTCNDRCTG